MSAYSYDDGHCYKDERGLEVGRNLIGWDGLKEKVKAGLLVERYVFEI